LFPGIEIRPIKLAIRVAPLPPFLPLKYPFLNHLFIVGVRVEVPFWPIILEVFVLLEAALDLPLRVDRLLSFIEHVVWLLFLFLALLVVRKVRIDAGLV
jgi:hypothetical protein